MINKRKHIDKEVRFTIGANDIFGILTLPASDGLHPAIVLLHGSDRSGVGDPYYKEHAENLVQSGFAVLRYDGPGWGGQSSQGPGFETLKYRTEEAIAAIKYIQSLPDINSKVVGLWGISQGGWICQMAAAVYARVAFIISISGPGVTPIEQEVYRVKAQSKAAGFNDEEVIKAVLMRRLMVDIVLATPVYQTINHSEATLLGKGPWDEMAKLVYTPNPIDPANELTKIIEILSAIKNERWTEFLHLERVLPMFENLPPQAWEGAKAQMRAVMDVEPADFLSKIHCPVLAIFGEHDTSLPVTKSVLLYKQYLSEAGNKAVTIKVFPEASHTIRVGEEYAPGYFELMLNWLSNLPIK